MRRTLKSVLLALVIGVTAGLALLVVAGTLIASEGQEGVVTATIKVNPLLVSLAVPGESVSVGERFTARARVENRGESRIRRVTATLQLPTGLEMHGPATRSVGTIGPFRSRSTQWHLEAVQAGSFVLMVTASGIDASDGNSVMSESDAKVVTVEGVLPTAEACVPGEEDDEGILLWHTDWDPLEAQGMCVSQEEAEDLGADLSSNET